MPTTINPRLISWASDIDDQAIRQAEKTARLPVVTGHVALMADAHVGIGATVGSVVPCSGAIIPSAVGVDIGCGMVAAELDLSAEQLPDSLEPLLGRVARAVPAGVGKGHDRSSPAAERWMADHPTESPVVRRHAVTAVRQFGSLGSGNHFAEVCLDERGRVWVVLHSGSRGVGNRIGTEHIATARHLSERLGMALEDRDLAYFVEGTAEFSAYVTDMLWAQGYARANRDQMMDALLAEVVAFVGHGRETSRVNCHHNFARREVHDGVDLWVTRKGAIRAGAGELGVIPGSMGTSSYIVRGRGNPASYESCAHGAGRRFSRGEARRRFSAADLEAQMGGKVWMRERPEALLDEIPSAYKDIDRVMRDQADLVEVVHTLHQVLNYKGT